MFLSPCECHDNHCIGSIFTDQRSAVEVLAKPQWCRFGQTVFARTRTRFPLHVRSARTLRLDQAPVVTVTGKAFWDVGHAPAHQSNRRKYQPDYAAWEIHPVMELDVR